MGIPGTGGSSFVTIESKGAYMSDECFKMALTDAISVACKAIGVGSSIYWNTSDSKYNKPSEPSVDLSKMTLEEVGQITLTFGKHKGKTLSTIAHEKNTSYLTWLSENASDATIKQASIILLAAIAQAKEKKGK
jgi:uncharacterized protein (DUF3820 family)